jgi:Bacterial Ig domain
MNSSRYALSPLMLVAILAIARNAAADCRIERIPSAKRGETITIVMHVTGDGSSCTLTPRVGQGQAQTIKVVQPPKNGRVEIAPPSAVYTPAPGFMGGDTFELAWFGTTFGNNTQAANFRTRVEVEVVPKRR